MRFANHTSYRILNRSGFRHHNCDRRASELTGVLAVRRREEVTILPATRKCFTDEQLGAMRANIQRNTPPERYAEWMSWMFPLLNINELTDTFVGLKKSAPAPVFENMARIAEQAISEERW